MRVTNLHFKVIKNTLVAEYYVSRTEQNNSA